MYHAIVRRIIRRAFADVSRGDFEAVLAQCSPDIRHRFAGDHAFGGERNDREMLRRWFRRVATVLPGLRLHISELFVQGMPWDTRAIVVWREEAELPDGRRYFNDGVHRIQLRWGRVTAISVHLDTQRAAALLQELGSMGIGGATAPPIVGASVGSGSDPDGGDRRGGSAPTLETLGRP